MSTFTPNFNLAKADGTDAANFMNYNQNWDIVDERLGQSRIQSYTELAQLGLSNDDMSTTDLTSNIDRIVTTIGKNAANLMLVISDEKHPNLYASVIAKLNTDTDITFSAPSHVGWLSIRYFGEEYRPVIVETNLETANYYDSIWTCVFNKGADGNKISAFKNVLTNDQMNCFVNSYTGDGTSRVTLQCPNGTPMCVILYGEFGVNKICSPILFKGMNTYEAHDWLGAGSYHETVNFPKIEWGANSISWYTTISSPSTDILKSLGNIDGRDYKYIIFYN